ncbi:hypothetical protein CTRI78_v005757 [Colletotrichum trifolii]|uniref:Uncharacterized protein n=1 Tax=Colletotrichum trifolii TaxID=5466 RepID=A0A4R8RE08_COLTR|nr:hypothetical protein CTRI78_v005757 [Colletotrichum trifolii]
MRLESLAGLRSRDPYLNNIQRQDRGYKQVTSHTDVERKTVTIKASYRRGRDNVY